MIGHRIFRLVFHEIDMFCRVEDAADCKVVAFAIDIRRKPAADRQIVYLST
jgi:hypothetical protein